MFNGGSCSGVIICPCENFPLPVKNDSSLIVDFSVIISIEKMPVRQILCTTLIQQVVCTVMGKIPILKPKVVPTCNLYNHVLRAVRITSGFPDYGFPAYFCHSKHVFQRKLK